jgi:hypothetical protein
MSDDALVGFESACRGRRGTIERREFDWLISFGGDDRLVVESPWRIVQNDRIVYGSPDDRQKFGLPEPIDGKAMANSLLKERRLNVVELDRITADLRLCFDGETRLDVFNHCAAYEGWQAAFAVEDDRILIIGMGSGSVSIFRQPRPVQKS